MLYLLIELTLFLIAAFALGWWTGRSQRVSPQPPRVVDVALDTVVHSEVKGPVSEPHR